MQLNNLDLNDAWQEYTWHIPLVIYTVKININEINKLITKKTLN